MLCRTWDDNIEMFEVECVAICSVMMKRLDELDPADDYQGMKQSRVFMYNVETDKEEYV